ncbi:unnamed protein product [Cuscuta campestris]|uniref:Cysteine-rich transmembrane CYSTM domain-containing protein n=1 Tax=Cuscuta campestris TaxID=132261 RepID=A0A484MPU3_9ASTE|nr:unnamed protein product [Cuscuta campestris]
MSYEPVSYETSDYESPQPPFQHARHSHQYAGEPAPPEYDQGYQGYYDQPSPPLPPSFPPLEDLPEHHEHYRDGCCSCLKPCFRILFCCWIFDCCCCC